MIREPISRRDFLKACLATITLSFPVLTPEFEAKPVIEKAKLYKFGKKIPSICIYCAGGCGVLATVLDNGILEIEGDPEHPINEGALCSKASAYYQSIYNERRLLQPLKRTNPRKGENEDPMWVPISWDEAFKIISEKVKIAMEGFPYKDNKDNYYRIGRDCPVASLGSAYFNNEECYLIKKMMSLLGSLNVEHQARKCHASTVVALANTFGFGAMTNHVIDAKNSKVFLILSNPAESHTMEFRWVTRAKERNNAKIIVLDPRYHRSASKADIYVRYRSGSEAIIFLGLIRYLMYEKPERIDWKYVEERTNAPYDLDGNKLDDWKTNKNSIFNKLKEIVGKFTPEEVERVSGIPKEKFYEIAETFTSLKPGNIYYAMGTTQHTNAVQAIRAQAILQLLLGNIGVPGGGVNALRGISNVQGSTDMNVLSHVIMGYRVPPRNLDDVRRYQKWKNTKPEERGGVPGGVPYPWSSIEEAAAQNKADVFRWDDRMFPTWNALEYHWGIYVGTWPGKDPDNEPVVCDLPIGTGNAIVQLFRAVMDGRIKVLFIFGENPVVSMPNANFIKESLKKEGLFTVVCDVFETETAVFADILLPGTFRIEREGSVTNTGRWIQWQWKAVDPPIEKYKGQPMNELILITEIFNVLRKNAGVKTPSELFEAEKGVSIKRVIGGVEVENNVDECWPSRFGRDAESIYKEICYKYGALKVGTAVLPQAPANIIYRDAYDPDPKYSSIGGILAKRRDRTPVDEEDAKYGYFKNWAFSWMRNQRILYNSKETQSYPPVNQFFTWWAHNPKVWLGWDKAALWSQPLYDPTKPAHDPRKYGFPLHNEPLESPDPNLAKEYPTMWDHTLIKDVVWFDIITKEIKRGKDEVIGKGEFPYILTTFRLAEHMQTGALTRNLAWLAELQPEMFVEISPELAKSLNVKTGDYVILKTARNITGIKVKAMVTERIKPLKINGKIIHEVAVPWHWGFKGLVTGASANDLTIDCVDLSANIPEYKVCLCSIEKV
ncbi:MAG: molybdopterin-dependent oxidoreductase [Candidatus Methanomethylicia archaeon]